MSRIVWGENKDYHSGIDRGVLYPDGKPAVPWNGLVSVTESGGQEISTYFQDGRKYLVVASPREYRGTIEAYTFPDEFAELCGIVEVADGMFLDSQQTGRFSLSYRTSVNGGEHHRIHLVYALTAATSDMTYDTHSNETEPTPFEFEIDAVPQVIEGYRPTAHVIIDTKNIDEDRIIQIEALIYGTSMGDDAHMPSLQEVFDILKFDDTLRITADTVARTFKITGSYKYIDQNLDGSWLVKNLTDEQVLYIESGEIYRLTTTD